MECGFVFISCICSGPSSFLCGSSLVCMSWRTNTGNPGHGEPDVPWLWLPDFGTGNDVLHITYLFDKDWCKFLFHECPGAGCILWSLLSRQGSLTFIVFSAVWLLLYCPHLSVGVLDLWDCCCILKLFLTLDSRLIEWLLLSSFCTYDCVAFWFLDEFQFCVSLSVRMFLFLASSLLQVDTFFWLARTSQWSYWGRGLDVSSAVGFLLSSSSIRVSWLLPSPRPPLMAGRGSSSAGQVSSLLFQTWCFSQTLRQGLGCRSGGSDGSGRWSSAESQLTVSCRELHAVRLGLWLFQEHIRGFSNVIFYGSVMAVSYHRKSTGSRSTLFSQEAQEVLHWVEERELKLLPQCIMGKQNIVADDLSWSQQVLGS